MVTSRPSDAPSHPHDTPNAMKPTTALACFLATCAAAVAQSQTLVIPVGAATTEGNTSNLFPWGRGGNGLRLQCVYDSANFTAQGVAGPITITQLSWRPDAGTPRTWLATNYQTTTIRLSTSPLDYGSASTTFANNVGADETTVYSGPISWPAGSSSAPGPAPFLVTVPLATPFVYDPTQGDLNVDIDLPVQAFSGTNLQFDASTVSPQASRVYVSTGYPSGPASFQNNHGMVLQVGYSPVIAAQPLAPHNLIVVRVGDGVTPLSSAAAPVFLEEYTTSGVLVQTIPMPTAASGSNHAFTLPGDTTLNCNPRLSFDRQCFVLVGYDAPPGTPAVASTSSSLVRRVIARIGMDGSIDTSTGLSDAYSGGEIYSVATSDGTQFWMAGSTDAASAGTGGVRYTTRGSGTSTQITNQIPDPHTVLISPTTLMSSSISGNLYSIGVGLSSTGGQLSTLQVIGIETTYYGEYYDSAGCVYALSKYRWQPVIPGPWVCGATHTKCCGGVYVWDHNYSIPCDSDLYTDYNGYGNFHGIGGLGSSLLEMNPATSASFITNILANAANFTLFKGVQRLGDSSSHVIGTGCAGTAGVPQLLSPILPQIGISSTLQLANLPLNVGVFVLSLAPMNPPLDLTFLGAPTCTLYQQLDVLATAFGTGGTATYSLAIPNSPALVGTQLFSQGVSLDPAANALGLTTSNGLVATIGW